MNAPRPPTDNPAASDGQRSLRIAGIAFVIAGVGAAIAATGFRVGFITDPVGPRALPWLGAALLAVGGTLMLFRPGQPPASPALPARTDVATALVTFAVYAMILSGAGFVLSTALLMTILARLYGGTWIRGGIAGVLFSASLWLLFAQALGVPLPVGSIFVVGG